MKLYLEGDILAKLPDDIIHRPKKGFGIPLARWLRAELRPLLVDVLNNAALRSQGPFDSVCVWCKSLLIILTAGATTVSCPGRLSYLSSGAAAME